MKPELEQSLYNKYPKIFKQKDLPMSQTCMCWGFECGDGWYDLLDTLCNKIQTYIDANQTPQVETVQVKEKFGGLRFYISGGDQKVYDLIHEAERESYKVCEKCGSKENVSQTKSGWIVTLCGVCMKQRQTNAV